MFRLTVANHASQAGQAVIEALLVLSILASAWLAILWLGRLQDAGLQMTHASRRLAFAHAHQGMADGDLTSLSSTYTEARGHRWASRHAPGRLVKGAEARLTHLRDIAAVHPGDPIAKAGPLRVEWNLGDERIWRAEAALTTYGGRQRSVGLRNFDSLALVVARHTAIMRGDGSANGDAAVQQTLGAGATAWASMADVSIQRGREIEQRMHGVDAAWGRQPPSWDWLTPWTSWVPQRHLQSEVLW